MKDFMNSLPTVISCCFCCFLRAGTVMIALFSFIAGLLFAPNVTQTPGFWDINPVLSNYSQLTENTIQMILGMISIMLCVVSILLAVGALCNMPTLIEIYQWGAMLYAITIFLLFLCMSFYCFFIQTNCFLAGVVLLILIVICVLFTIYFILVANSLRMSLKYLNSDIII